MCIYKDLSASFSSSLCSRFVKIMVNNQGKIRKKQTGMVTPPPSLVHYTKKGTYPGNPPPQPPDPSPWPGPGEFKVNLFSGSSRASRRSLKGFSTLLSTSPEPPSTGGRPAALQRLKCFKRLGGGMSKESTVRCQKMLKRT